MVNPCENCLAVEDIQDLDVISDTFVQTTTAQNQEMWDAYTDFRQNTLRPHGESPAEVAATDQIKACLSDVGPKFLAISQTAIIEVEEGKATIEGIDCGSSPIGCPKREAFMQLFSKVSQDLEDFVIQSPVA